MIDKVTGKKYEKYVEEVEEVGNEELNNFSYSNAEFPESFDDEFPEDEKLIDSQNLVSSL